MNQIVRILESDGLMEPLDMLLADVAIRVQLTATDHGKAEERWNCSSDRLHTPTGSHRPGAFRLGHDPSGNRRSVGLR
jgi:hypothetical protein